MSKSDELKAELDAIEGELRNVNRDIGVLRERQKELEQKRLDKADERNRALQAELDELQRQLSKREGN